MKEPLFSQAALATRYGINTIHVNKLVYNGSRLRESERLVDLDVADGDCFDLCAEQIGD